jgi:trans-aconitate methyltransferase
MKQNKFHDLYEALMSNEIYDFYAQLIDSIDPHATIIDAGCGSGELAHRLSLFTKDVCGFDLDETLIEKAKTKLNLPFFVKHDMHEPWPFYGSLVCMSQDVINFTNKPYLVLKRAIDAIMGEGVIVFDMYVDVKDYEEKGIEPYSYVWKRTLDGPIITHDVLIEDEHYIFKQYVHPLEDIQSWLINMGFHVETMDYINKEKIVLIASR